jgi:hypothetical protein
MRNEKISLRFLGIVFIGISLLIVMLSIKLLHLTFLSSSLWWTFFFIQGVLAFSFSLEKFPTLNLITNIGKLGTVIHNILTVTGHLKPATRGRLKSGQW